MNLKISIKLLSIIFTLVLTSCEPKHDAETVKIDTYFSELFIRTGDGLTGGDGTYSVELPDGRSVWIFGDTFLGTVEADKSRELSDPMYIRNSFVIQKGNELSTLFQNSDGVDRSMAIPPKVTESNFEITEKDYWYWPGDGFVENNELKVFMSEFHQSDTGMWDFEWKGTALVSYTLPNIEQTSIIEFDFENAQNIHYGHAILEEDDFTYIFGLGSGKIHIARAKVGKIDSDWEFYTSTGWSSNATNSTPILDIDGSEQFSVLKWEDKYVLITQLSSLSTEICSFVSDKPWTDWKNKQTLYNTPLPEGDHNLFTYNAVVHPQFSNENGILISYNTNSFILSEHFENSDIYRPRFIRVPLSYINKETSTESINIKENKNGNFSEK